MSENEPPPPYPGASGYSPANPNYGAISPAPTNSRLYDGGPPHNYSSPQYPTQPYSQYPPLSQPPQNYPSPQYPTQPYSQYPPLSQPPQNYRPPPGVITTDEPVITRVVVVAAGTCPTCRVGYQIESFSVLGIICAIFCFPVGLFCLLLCKDRKCSHCGHIFE